MQISPDYFLTWAICMMVVGMITMIGCLYLNIRLLCCVRKGLYVRDITGMQVRLILISLITYVLALVIITAGFILASQF